MDAKIAIEIQSKRVADIDLAAYCSEQISVASNEAEIGAALALQEVLRKKFSIVDATTV